MGGISKRIWAAVVTLVVLFASSWVAQAEEAPVKAYKDLYFGESRSQTTKRISADKSLLGNTYACLTKIGNQQYGVRFDFYQDRLYRIRLTSDFLFSTRIYSASQFDTALASEIETLRGVIEAQYGPPHAVDSVTLLDMRDGMIRFKYAWNIDNVKEIKIGIACKGFTYWAELWIGYIPILQEITAQEAAQKGEEARKAATDF